jgi:hypothetical protein
VHARACGWQQSCSQPVPSLCERLQPVVLLAKCAGTLPSPPGFCRRSAPCRDGARHDDATGQNCQTTLPLGSQSGSFGSYSAARDNNWEGMDDNNWEGMDDVG